MARLVVKVKYMKSSKGRKMGGYAEYIGTREGVAKIDDSHKKKLLPSDGVLLDENSSGMFPEGISPKTYADYIATRPRAERNGQHGLFTDAGVEVDLKDVSRELNAFEGTIWTAIISIRREDAEKLGFDTGARWRNMLRAHRDELAEIFRIKPETFTWYSAFHDEGHHPHVHMIIYDKANNGYLDKEGVERIKSIFAHDIFRDEILTIEREKTEKRDLLRQIGKDEIEEVIRRIHDGSEENVMLQAMLLDLARRLRSHKGKKYYSYLKASDKRLVDSIVDVIGTIPAVEDLYFRWYESQVQLSRIYKMDIPEKVPLSANPVFKVLRNEVIRAAGELEVDESLLDETDVLDEELEGEVIEIGGERPLPSHVSDFSSNPLSSRDAWTSQNGKVALCVTRLLNNVSRIFRDQFQDHPSHTAKVDRKIRRKIMEKEEAHGMKHG